MEEQRDEKLWVIARKRAEFRKSLYSFIIMNTIFWFTWWFTTGHKGGDMNDRSIPWPLWVMFGWGIALAYNYYKAFYSDKSNMVEREYERLKRKKQI